jgi:ArsR family transcriptional regulator, arsenate/arsenite/antimonite-responsive transcriptional repressor
MEKAFKALASELRRRVLNHLAGGRLTVTEMSAHFDMAMPSILQRVAILKEAGLAREHERGQFGRYSLAADHMANLLYGFLTPFRRDARKIVKARKLKADNAGRRS